jgi:hypothetical protein
MLIDLTHNDVEKLCLSVRSFGFGLLPGAIVPSVLRGLQHEADERVGAAKLAQTSADFKYRANITSLGPQASDFLHSQQLTGLLATIFGERFVLTENRSCLTFYREGDHLGPHLDMPAEECVVTIIVCIAATGPAQRSPQTGLELRVYGQEMTSNRETRLTIPTHTGAIVVGRGSKFWHERPMLRKGEQATALTGCYGLAARPDDTASDRNASPRVPDGPGASSASEER